MAGRGHEKEIKFLKRVITYNIDGWTWTGDPTHSEKLVNEVNLGGAKGAVTPGSKATGINDPHSKDNLTPEKSEKFRTLVERLLCHSLDDPRVQFETGLLMRGMSKPRLIDEARLHRAVRDIAGTPGVDWLFRWQGGAETLKFYGLADADHTAGDESRRSVSCSQEFLGCHLLDQEVGRHTCVAFSSGESEFHALTLCAARLIFLWEARLPIRTLQRQEALRWEVQASSSQKSLVTTGLSGWTGESRQGRHVAENCRLRNEVFGRGTTEAVDCSASCANMREGMSERSTGGVRRMPCHEKRWWSR